jgi:hypothetical protein
MIFLTRRHKEIIKIKGMKKLLSFKNIVAIFAKQFRTLRVKKSVKNEL